MNQPTAPNSSLPSEWRRLSTKVLVESIQNSLLGNSLEGAPSAAAVVREAREEALRIANNLKYGPESSFVDHRNILHPIHSPHFAALLTRIDLRPESTIVDMGVNDGFEIGAIETWGGAGFLERVTLWGIDISDAAIQKARITYPGANMHFLQGNGENLLGANADGTLERIPDNCADLYLCLNSFQSTLLDKRLAFLSALRVLKKEGAMIIVIPPFHDASTGAENFARKAEAVAEITSLFQGTNFRFEIFGAAERYTFILGVSIDG